MLTLQSGRGWQSTEQSAWAEETRARIGHPMRRHPFPRKRLLAATRHRCTGAGIRISTVLTRPQPTPAVLWAAPGRPRRSRLQDPGTQLRAWGHTQCTPAWPRRARGRRARAGHEGSMWALCAPERCRTLRSHISRSGLAPRRCSALQRQVSGSRAGAQKAVSIQHILYCTPRQAKKSDTPVSGSQTGKVSDLTLTRPRLAHA